MQDTLLVLTTMPGDAPLPFLSFPNAKLGIRSEFCRKLTVPQELKTNISSLLESWVNWIYVQSVQEGLHAEMCLLLAIISSSKDNKGNNVAGGIPML